MNARLVAGSTLVLLLGVASSGAAEPARRSGVAEVVDADVPLIRSWKPAEFPAGVPKDVQTGTATIRAIVDATGKVTSARVLEESDPAFGASAMAAINEWTFAPRMENEVPQPGCVDVPFVMRRQARDGASAPPRATYVARTPASVESAPLGPYPAALAGRGFSGEVDYVCMVDEKGEVSRFIILAASDAEFVLPTLESVPDWRFKPAMEGDLALAAPLRGRVSFGESGPYSRMQVLEMNGITLAGDGEPNSAPRVICASDPVYPYELLLKGEGGTATVEFTLTQRGTVSEIQVKEASHPDFAAALVAAMATWSFEPAMHEGRRVDVRMIKKAEFKPVSAEAGADESPMARLLQRVRAEAVKGGRGLDGKLTPIYRVAPVLPEGVETAGKAQVVVDFIIDEDGRARLPRVISAPNPELGWAAATAVSQWVFGAPKRGGEPTDVKVQVPLTF